jgi:predicted amidohydrolase
MNVILMQPRLKAFDAEANESAIESLVAGAGRRIAEDDILLLPEHFTSTREPARYMEFLQRLRKRAGCTIVGGSHHRKHDGTHINAGTIIAHDGREIGTYEKLRPYFNEQLRVSPGEGLGEFTINGRNILVLICADFWYSDILLRSTRAPDLILVPSLSVSRKPAPAFSRSLWRHLAIARAYEFGAYVGISDWHDESSLPKYRTSGVSGFADPTQLEPEQFFRPVGDEGISFFPLDFQALDDFRRDRKNRGFFWKAP